MEKFKKLEEIIDSCKADLFMHKNNTNLQVTLGLEELRELQKLLSNNRQLQTHLLLYINKNEEQEKLMRYMLTDFLDHTWYILDCEACPKSGNCKETDEDCREAIIEHYKKKFKAEKK